MPLRIIVELVPHGEEHRRHKLAVLDIENDGTADSRGSGPVGNYLIRTSADCGDAGWDDLNDLRVVGIPRLLDEQRLYLDTAAACLAAVSREIVKQHPSKTPCAE
jgi:hypothetical protein